MFLKGFEGWHLVIIAGLLVVLFGARKLPASARSIGQSLRIFKSEMAAVGQDERAREQALELEREQQLEQQREQEPARPAEFGVLSRESNR